MNNKNRIADEIEQAEKEWGVSGGKSDFLKLQEGENPMRILTPLFSYPSHFKVGACVGKEQCPECKKTRKDKDGNEVPNKPSVKFLCNVLAYPTQAQKDYAKANGLPEPEATIKIGQFSYGITKALQDLQDDPEWAFDSFPMPYNIKIKAVGAGKKEVEYTVIASPKHTPIDPQVLMNLSKMNTPEQIRDNFKKSQMKKLGLLAVEDNGKQKVADTGIDYPENDLDTSEVPF